MLRGDLERREGNLIASRAFTHAGLQSFQRVGWVGLEPTTNALKGRCSTIELPTRRNLTPMLRMKTPSRRLRNERLCDVEPPNWNIAAQ